MALTFPEDDMHKLLYNSVGTVALVCGCCPPVPVPVNIFFVQQMIESGSLLEDANVLINNFIH